MKPNKQTDWEKEFDKTFYSKGGGLLIRKYEDYTSEIEVKDFIRQLLSTQRQQLLDILKHNQDNMTGLYDYDGIAQEVIDLVKK